MENTKNVELQQKSSEVIGEKEMTEQIKSFNEAYDIAKKLGFENYFCVGGITWKEAKENFDNGLRLSNGIVVFMLQQNVDIVIAEKNLPVCESCKQIMNPQEQRAGFTKCEHCDGVCGCHSIKKEVNN